MCFTLVVVLPGPRGCMQVHHCLCQLALRSGHFLFKYTSRRGQTLAGKRLWLSSWMLGDINPHVFPAALPLQVSCFSRLQIASPAQFLQVLDGMRHRFEMPLLTAGPGL